MGGVVLLVEDDEVVRALLVLDLQDRGIAVREEADHASALEALESEPDEFTALVTDLDLGPGQPNGPALAAEARLLRPHLAVVFITGHPRWRAWHGHGAHVLEKPFRADELEAVLLKVCAVKR